MIIPKLKLGLQIFFPKISNLTNLWWNISAQIP